MTDPRISPEQLAALLDGTLSREERAQLLTELADSPEDVALLLESAAIADAADAATVVPLVPRRPWLQWGLAAAAVVTAVVAVSLLRQPAEPEVLALVTELDGRVPPGDAWTEAPWTTTRGGDVDGTDPVLAFRVGVRLVDLETAAQAGQPQLTAQMADELSRLLGGTPGGAPFAARYTLLGEAAPDRERLALASEVSELFGDSPWLGAGAWLRTAHLASQLQDDAFFGTGSPAMRRLDEVIVAIEGVGAGNGPGLAAGLRDVRELAARAGPRDWNELEGRIFRLLDEGPP